MIKYPLKKNQVFCPTDFQQRKLFMFFLFHNFFTDRKDDFKDNEIFSAPSNDNFKTKDTSVCILMLPKGRCLKING